MASVRCRNGRWYYRITVSKAGKKKYIERGGFDSSETAIEASRSLNKALLGYETSVGLYNYEKLVNEAFRRFPEGHPYHIPLLLGYKYAMSIEEIFDLEIQDVNMTEHKLKELYLDDE